MEKAVYTNIENYMLQCNRDAAHGEDHIYRVLYNALDIARTENNVDYDVLIAACLLHDIGRKEQFADARIDHAEVGGDKAYTFLIGLGFSTAFAQKVKSCIVTHRFRKDGKPESLEAEILFDADKLDVTGVIGVARTLAYKSEVGDPLYSLGGDRLPTNGDGDDKPSFFQEYHYKLKKLYNRFYTKRGACLAAERERAARDFYENLLFEVRSAYGNGLKEFDKHITE